MEEKITNIKQCYEGMMVIVEWYNGNITNECRIHIHNGARRIHLCQNEKDGDGIEYRYGFDYSWTISITLSGGTLKLLSNDVKKMIIHPDSDKLILKNDEKEL